MSCSSCKFFLLGEFGKYCRRYPPQIFIEIDCGESNSFSKFPSTSEDEWCGEYQKAEDT